MNFIDLTPEVRAFMADEVAGDESSGRLYTSPRLTDDVGVRDYPAILAEAVREHDPEWFAAELRENGRLKTVETYTSGGVTRNRKVASNAAEMMAEGEFNRFYCRAICLAVLRNDPNAELVVYRAKAAANPRPESERLVGTKVKAAALLADLRSRVGVDTALGVPAGPNSGLSVRVAVAA